jgi:formate hydrogenlyase subunit 3/multisubunit Na+/H+ antiporter MnhD subunit
VAAKRVSGVRAEALFSSDFDPLKTELVRAPALAILLLVVAATLGVYKPWGMTRYGRRKQQRHKSQTQPEETPLGVKIFLAVIAALMLAFIVLHLTGHGFGGHGH